MYILQLHSSGGTLPANKHLGPYAWRRRKLVAN